MRIVFRADASQRIGSGHVTRCLTLAERLRRGGDEVLFVSRAHPGNLNPAIRAAGFELLELTEPADAERKPAATGGDAYAHWLGVSQEEDAGETLRALGEGRAADWLVVDHYGLDRDWELQLHPHTGRIAVIDDLANRSHDADLLVDPLLGRDAQDYRGLLPAACKTLLGPAYAPLRPEFARLRAGGEPDRSQQSSRLLINLGGADPHGATRIVLAGLQGADLPGDLHIEVVLGSDTDALAAVKQALQALPYRTEVTGAVTDLARRMQAADLAVGAAGMSAWERCCLGVPAVIITIADNQRRIADALDQAGAAHWLGDLAEVTADPTRVGTAVAGLLGDPPRRAAMARAASGVTDGLGADRIAAAMHGRDET